MSRTACRIRWLVSRTAAIESGRLEEHKAPRTAALLHLASIDQAVKTAENAGLRSRNNGRSSRSASRGFREGGAAIDGTSVVTLWVGLSPLAAGDVGHGAG